VFTGKERLDAHAKHHLHESPFSMTFPLQVLALLSLAGGALSLPHFVHWDVLGDYLGPTFAPAQAIRAHSVTHGAFVEIGLMLLSLVVVVSGAFWAWMKYADGPGAEIERPRRGLPFLLENKWFIDELYAIFVVGPMRVLSHLSGFFDRYVIDGIVHGIARSINFFGAVVRQLQSGVVQTYALLFIAGAVFLAVSLL
jgi:NADH-quinone oxidoreductase subunit L